MSTKFLNSNIINDLFSLDPSLIKDIRKKLGKTQAQIAAAINMDRSYYSRKESESGEIEFSPSELQTIIDYFSECYREFVENKKKLAALDGGEKIGKSTLALQLAKRLSEERIDSRVLYTQAHKLLSESDLQQILPEYPEVRHYISIINEAAKVNDLEMIFFSMNKTLKLLKEKYKINVNGHQHIEEKNNQQEK
jgi:transcriptional regulator with XRE-family HTH domain